MCQNIFKVPEMDVLFGITIFRRTILFFLIVGMLVSNGSIISAVRWASFLFISIINPDFHSSGIFLIREQIIIIEINVSRDVQIKFTFIERNGKLGLEMVLNI